MSCKFRSTKTTITILALLITALGCAGSADKIAEVKPVEIGPGVSVDTPEAELFKDAELFYAKSLYTNARETFEKIRDGYPFGPYAEFAEIKVADCHFYTYDYQTSALLYADFVKQRPTSSNAPYALVQLGRSYDLQYTGEGRDAEPLNKARDAFKELLKRFPHSIYLTAAKDYLQKTEEQILAYENSVASFYKRMGHEKAYEARKTRAEGLAGNFDSERQSLPAPDIKLAAVEVPELYRGSFETTPASHSNAKASLRAGKPQLDQSADYKIFRIACDQEKDSMVIFVNKPIEGEALTKLKNSVVNKDNSLSMLLPNGTSEALRLDCFGDKDLLVSDTAQLVLSTTKAATLFPLNFPPRIVVSLD